MTMKPLSDPEVRHKIKNFYDPTRLVRLQYQDQEYLSQEDFDKAIPEEKRIKAFGI